MISSFFSSDKNNPFIFFPSMTTTLTNTTIPSSSSKLAYFLLQGYSTEIQIDQILNQLREEINIHVISRFEQKVFKDNSMIIIAQGLPIQTFREWLYMDIWNKLIVNHKYYLYSLYIYFIFTIGMLDKTYQEQLEPNQHKRNIIFSEFRRMTKNATCGKDELNVILHNEPVPRKDITIQLLMDAISIAYLQL